MSAGLVVISCPTRSAQGPVGPGFYGRFPQGNAPGGSQLEAAANDTTAAVGNIGSGTDSLTIIFPTVMPELSAGSPVLFTLTAIGGTGDFVTWSMTAAPPGVTIDDNGDFEGTPTTPGEFHPVIMVTDSAGNFGQTTFTCIVN
jgi:Putative Ig domain